MSLLMDALKKAELAKRQGQTDSAAESPDAESAQGGLALEPMGSANPTQSVAEIPAAGKETPADVLPHLSSHLEELDAQFLAEAKQAASARLKPPQSSASARELGIEQPPTAETQGRAAPGQARNLAPEQSAPRQSAQNVFAAKQAAKQPARKSFAVAIGIFTVLAVGGIGGYFWWQLQPKAAPIAARAPVAPTPTTSPAPISKPTAVPSAPTFATPADASSPVRLAAKAPADDEEASTVVQKTPAPVRRQSTAPTASADPDSLVRVTKAPLKVNPALLRGYDAFNRGDLALAQLEYERAQKSDPRNTDVLHGLAAIATRQGRLDQAEWLYRQITEADPQDTVAMAALINTRGQIDPGAAESRLKTLSAAQPELAAPHFSLGNLYATHGRWNDAQQAYFRAYTAEPDNPDILYNLAISLEHLRQNKLAAQYYSQALTAAQSKPAGFDKARAAARLAVLQR
jgi:Tfp pilus assembly protein PilF/nitrate reductase NapE component